MLSSIKIKYKITGNTYNVAEGADGHDANRVGKQDVTNGDQLLESIKHTIN